jgi:hypothetical protein
LNKTMKKAAGTFLAAALIVTLTSGTAAACTQPNAGQTQKNLTYLQKISQPTKSQKQQERQQGFSKQGHESSGVTGNKLNPDQIQKAIDAVTDADTKAKLQSLLTAYTNLKTEKETALKNATDKDAAKAIKDSYREKLQTALKALTDALKEAGVQYQATPQGGGSGFGSPGYILNPDQIQKAIDAVTDADTKAKLQSLLSTYTNLKTEMATALKNAASKDAAKAILDAYREKLQTAGKALFDALKDAKVKVLKDAKVQSQAVQQVKDKQWSGAFGSPWLLFKGQLQANTVQKSGTKL